MEKHWVVELTAKADKAKEKLPNKIQDLASLLLKELEITGPIQRNWKNFGPLSDISYHCHIKKGKPTYVACWRVDKKRKMIEVYYVGTHEGAPY